MQHRDVAKTSFKRRFPQNFTRHAAARSCVYETGGTASPTSWVVSLGCPRTQQIEITRQATNLLQCTFAASDYGCHESTCREQAGQGAKHAIAAMATSRSP